MMDPSPHRIAHELVMQLAGDEALASASVDLFGEAPAFYLDDDDPDNKAPHIMATPEASEEGIGSDGDIRIRLAVSAFARPEEDRLTPDGATPGLFLKPSAARFDAFARAAWAAVRRTRPGAILVSHSAEWGFGELYPLIYVIYTLNYQTIQAFGDS